MSGMGLARRRATRLTATAKERRFEALPKVFIGSSSEGLRIAEILQMQLDQMADVKLWKQGVFTPGASTLESLTLAVPEFDFAVIVLSPDDTTRTRGKQILSPRDNVVFEIGLFMGTLGPSRTFMVYNGGAAPKLPSDLLGVTALTYRERGDGDLEAALGPVATQLKQRFEHMGARTQPPPAGKGPNGVGARIYLSAPHKNVARNEEVRQVLSVYGVQVNMPVDLVAEYARGGGQASAKMIRTVCNQAILESSVVVVDLDTYGLDSAWEMGFAEAQRIPVVGFSRDEGVIVNARPVHLRKYDGNFMHGWDEHEAFDDLESLEPHCDGKVVYVCGSFRNDAAMEELRGSQLARSAKRLILPRDLFYLGQSFPKDYPWRARDQNVRMLRDADVALVILPRYGMDTSWQLGYACGTGKTIIGWITSDIGPEVAEAPVWDHWMHAWKEKLTVTNLTELAAVILGLHQTRLATAKAV